MALVAERARYLVSTLPKKRGFENLLGDVPAIGEMTPREAALQKIAVGDIFHASGTNGASFICLALQVRESAVFARRVTTQSVHWFDLITGVDRDNPKIAIDSVAPLPEDIREVLLGLDRKYRENEYRWAEDPDWEPPEGSSRLTPEQRRAILFIADFYPAHPLPPRQ